MNSKEWLEVMEQAQDYNPHMTNLIKQYGKMVLDEHAGAKPTMKEINYEIDELFSMHGLDNGRYVSQEIAKWILQKWNIDDANTK